MGFLQQKVQIRDLSQSQRESKAPYLPFSGSNNGVVYVSESHTSSVICIESGLGRDVQISKLFCTLPSPVLNRKSILEIILYLVFRAHPTRSGVT